MMSFSQKIQIRYVVVSELLFHVSYTGHCGHQCLAKCMQTSAKCGEDAAAVARLESAAGQGRLPRRPGALYARRHLAQRSRP